MYNNLYTIYYEILCIKYYLIKILLLIKYDYVFYS